MFPMYVVRSLGGLLYLAGFLIMVFNIWMTVKGRIRDEKPMTDAAFDPALDRPLPAGAKPLRAPQPANDPDAPLIAAE
jgi:cytochrome c oxidase cbb3-type subunit 1